MSELHHYVTGDENLEALTPEQHRAKHPVVPSPEPSLTPTLEERIEIKVTKWEQGKGGVTIRDFVKLLREAATALRSAEEENQRLRERVETFLSTQPERGEAWSLWEQNDDLKRMLGVAEAELEATRSREAALREALDWFLHGDWDTRHDIASWDRPRSSGNGFYLPDAFIGEVIQRFEAALAATPQEEERTLGATCENCGKPLVLVDTPVLGGKHHVHVFSEDSMKCGLPSPVATDSESGAVVEGRGNER